MESGHPTRGRSEALGFAEPNSENARRLHFLSFVLGSGFLVPGAWFLSSWSVFAAVCGVFGLGWWFFGGCVVACRVVGCGGFGATFGGCAGVCLAWCCWLVGRVVVPFPLPCGLCLVRLALRWCLSPLSLPCGVAGCWGFPSSLWGVVGFEGFGADLCSALQSFSRSATMSPWSIERRRRACGSGMSTGF